MRERAGNSAAEGRTADPGTTVDYWHRAFMERLRFDERGFEENVLLWERMLWEVNHGKLRWGKYAPAKKQDHRAKYCGLVDLFKTMIAWILIHILLLCTSSLATVHSVYLTLCASHQSTCRLTFEPHMHRCNMEYCTVCRSFRISGTF